MTSPDSDSVFRSDNILSTPDRMAASQSPEAAARLQEMRNAELPEARVSVVHPDGSVEDMGSGTVEEAVAEIDEKLRGHVAQELLDPDWEYDRLEFAGDRLAIRKPTQQALQGFAYGNSRYITGAKKNDLVGLFMVEHLGSDSYDRVQQRLMRVKDPDYTTDTVGKIMAAIVQSAVDDALDKIGDAL